MIERMVVVVEDETIYHDLYRKVLEKTGLNFEIFSHPIEALIVMEHSPVHLLITDLQMPDMDGYELVEIFRQLPDKEEHLPAIMITAQPESLRQAFFMRNTFTILKPFDLRFLRESISMILK